MSMVDQTVKSVVNKSAHPYTVGLLLPPVCQPDNPQRLQGLNKLDHSGLTGNVSFLPFL